MTIPEIADALESAARKGAKQKRRPEKMRRGICSNMEFKTMGRELRLASADRPDAETFEGRRQ